MTLSKLTYHNISEITSVIYWQRTKSQNSTVSEYYYHLKDHLGNVRVTFSTTPESYMMVETFETGEDNGWQDLHRHTSASANTTPGGDEVERLQSGQTGAMIFLSMNKGDTVDLSVQANYESAPSNNTFVATAYSSLFGTYNSSFAGGEAGSTIENEFNDVLSGTNMAGKGSTSSAPRAFLNYIFFDEEMNYVTAGFQQISTAALGTGVHETISINDIIAEQEGYILAYLSNENQEAVNIHWDDFTVYHGKTNVVSTQDYYPFGMVMRSTARTASVPQRFKYNSFEFMDDLNLNLYDYLARQYDPAIGRFINVDPAADLMRRHSPYNYAFDNPIRYIDPDGMMPTEINGDCENGDCPETQQEIETTNKEEEPNRLEQLYNDFMDFLTSVEIETSFSGKATGGFQFSIEKEKTGGFTINFLNAVLGDVEGGLNFSSEGLDYEFDFIPDDSGDVEIGQELSFSAFERGAGVSQEFNVVENPNDPLGFGYDKHLIKASAGSSTLAAEVEYDGLSNDVKTRVRATQSYRFAIGLGFEGKFEASMTWGNKKKP